MLIFFPTSVTCAKHSGFGNACTYNNDAAPPVPFVNGGTRPPGPPAMPTFSGIVCGAKTGKTCNSTTFHLTGHFQHRSNSTNRRIMRRYLFYTVTFSHTDPTLPTPMEKPYTPMSFVAVRCTYYTHPLVSSDGCSTPRCTTGCVSRPPGNVSTTGQTLSPCCSVRHGCTGTAPKRYVWPDLHVFCILTVI